MTPKTVILGVGGYLGHDANAALVVDGLLVAASQEERFTRRQHDGGFPFRVPLRTVSRLVRMTIPEAMLCERPVLSTPSAERRIGCATATRVFSAPHPPCRS